MVGKYHDTNHASNEQTPGCLGHVGDHTTQLHGDYYKALQGSLLNQ